MAGPEQRGESWRLGRLTLLEPLRADEPQGPWVGREAGRLALLAVDRVAHPDLFHRGRVRALTHPAIESLIDRRAEDGRWVQIRELVLGASLRDVLAALGRRGEHVPPSVARLWGEAVLDALEFLERAEAEGTPLRLRHGALSADTVWVTFEGGLRVSDHELLRLRTPDQEPTLPGDVEALARDVHAAGALLREMIVGAGDRPQRRDLSPSTVAELERALRPRSDGDDTFGAFAARARPCLAALAPSASEAEVGEWLGRSVPEVERATLSRLRRIRAIGARASPTEASEDDQPTLAALELGVSEPFEPSVITMPGERVSPDRMASQQSAEDDHEAPTRPGRRRRGARARTRASIGVAAAVAALLAAGWWLGGSVAGRRDADRAPRVVASPSMETDAAADGASGAAAPPASPDASVEARRRDRATREVRSRPPRAASAAAGSDQADAPAAPAARSPDSDLRARLVAAEEAPDDPRAFEAALRAARERLATLGSAAETEAGRSAQASLRRAELSWDLEALRRAVRRVEALGAPP